MTATILAFLSNTIFSTSRRNAVLIIEAQSPKP